MSRRIVLGKLPDGNFGLRVSKSGFDAGAVPPVPANLIFDSAWPGNFPIHAIGTASVGYGSGTLVTTINFPALSYQPLFAFGLASMPSAPGYAFQYPYQSEYTVAANNGNSNSQFIVEVTKSSIVFTYAKNQYGSLPNPIQLVYVIFKLGVAF